MDKIDSKLKLLNERFDEMAIEIKTELLKNQFAWQDSFAKSIYKHEVKDGTVNLYPKSYIEADNVQIDDHKLWNEIEFYGIISEWSNEVPKLKFTSIGNYILFFKSVFHQEYQLSIKSININQRLSSEEMKIKMKELNHQKIENWESLEKYFYLKGIEVINQK